MRARQRSVVRRVSMGVTREWRVVRREWRVLCGTGVFLPRSPAGETAFMTLPDKGQFANVATILADVLTLRLIPLRTALKASLRSRVHIGLDRGGRKIVHAIPP